MKKRICRLNINNPVTTLIQNGLKHNNHFNSNPDRHSGNFRRWQARHWQALDFMPDKARDPFALKRDAIKILFVASHFRPVIIFTIASVGHSAAFHGF